MENELNILKIQCKMCGKKSIVSIPKAMPFREFFSFHECINCKTFNQFKILKIETTK